MNPPIRLLISARDPGAASHLLPVIQYLARHPSFAIQVLAAPPADQTFRLAAIEFEPVLERDDALHKRVRRLLARHCPEAILTGLSGPDSGLDEVLLAEAKEIPSFAYQDFWGDVNLTEGRAADCYLVRDDYAARLTKRRFDVEAVVVGSTTEQPPTTFQLPRRRRDSSVERVAWCGQPLWGVPGYAETYRTFARLFRHARILVKPHPKEGHRQTLKYRCLTRGRKLELWRGSLEGLFETCSLVASAFSNCALEHTAYNARVGTGVSTPAQLLFDRRLKNTYRTWTGIDRLPLTDQGLVLGVSSRKMLETQLSESKRRDFDQRSKWRTRRLARSLHAPQRIAETLLAKMRGPEIPNPRSS